MPVWTALSLSRVAALNRLSTTLVKLGAVVCLVLHALILSNVSAPALLSALHDAGSQPTGGEERADNDLWEMLLHFPIFPLPPLPPTYCASL